MSRGIKIFYRQFTRTILITLVLAFMSCTKSDKNSQQEIGESSVQTIQSMNALKDILEASGDRLLMFDLYADWCMPCRILSPILEEIAKENSERVAVYKINIDQNPDIARAFRVTGIPYVVFIKNKTAVQALTGVQPKETYVRAIHRLYDGDAEKPVVTPDGKIVDGVRIIRLSPSSSPWEIHVYRGETVKFIIEQIDFAYSIHIPEFGISEEGTIGKDLEVQFKAEKIGVFPVFCNGQCPTGDGARYGQIVVMQYEASGDAEFTEIGVEDAVKLIEESDPLILDVRTPNEYYSGHIEGARLIPLQQLESRLSEIKDYKTEPVLVYCRSGNRSTVASEILIRNGFKNLYNLRRGIIGWQRGRNQLAK